MPDSFLDCVRENIEAFGGDPDIMCFHASELWYTFGSLREGVPPYRRWTELDYALAAQITSYFPGQAD